MNGRDADLVQRFEQFRLGDRGPDESDGLLRGGLGAVGMGPACLLADVGRQEEVRVHAAALERSPEGGLVELGRARGDDHAVETERLDVVDDRLLALVGAHEHDVAGDRHAVELGRLGATLSTSTTSEMLPPQWQT
jgi:hypothetical protein